MSANQAPAAVLKALGTTLQGLQSTEAGIRLGRDGENTIHTTDHSGWVVLGRQFRSPMVLLLVVALAVSGILREFVDAITIAVIVVINAVLGFVQEYKSAKYLQKLQTIVHDHAVVRRGGKELVISRSEVVVGDIVLVRTGDVVPADIRLCEVKNFL
ncbi:MAG: cation-transporting P-type ATPase, partial [Patescibacteria group bacterium]